MLARMKTEEEYEEDGMIGDDAVETLSGLIRTARTLTTQCAKPLDRDPCGARSTQRHNRPQQEKRTT